MPVRIYSFWIFSDSKPTFKVTILHTNDRQAKIKSCGCRSAENLLMNLAVWMDSLSRVCPNPVVVDAGNSLFGDSKADASKGEMMVDALNAIHYDAVNICLKDLRYGIATLKELSRKAQFSFVSANLFPVQGTDPLFPPYRIINRDGIRIGIIGITEDNPVVAKSLPDYQKGFRVVSHDSVLPELVKKLDSKTDLLILLGYQEFNQNIDMLNRYPQIDVVISGSNRQMQYRSINDGLVGEAHDSGQYIGKITLARENGKIITLKGETISASKKSNPHPEIESIMKKYHLSMR